MSEQSRTGSFNAHQRALYSAGRDPRYVDTRLQGASGRNIPTGHPEGREQTAKLEGGTEQDSEGRGAGRLAAGSRDLEVLEGAWGAAEVLHPSGAPCQAHQLCEETRVELNSQTCFKPEITDLSNRRLSNTARVSSNLPPLPASRNLNCKL